MQNLGSIVKPQGTTLSLEVVTNGRQTMPEQKPVQPYITVTKAAAMLGVTRQRVLQLAKDIDGAYQDEESNRWFLPRVAVEQMVTERNRLLNDK